MHRVAAGESLLDPKVTARVLERLRSGPQQDPRLASLTDQERRILDLIAEGLTNRQIGTRLGLAEKTVKNYVSSMLAKIGVAAVHRLRSTWPADLPDWIGSFVPDGAGARSQ